MVFPSPKVSTVTVSELFTGIATVHDSPDIPWDIFPFLLLTEKGCVSPSDRLMSSRVLFGWNATLSAPSLSVHRQDFDPAASLVVPVFSVLILFSCFWFSVSHGDMFSSEAASVLSWADLSVSPAVSVPFEGEQEEVAAAARRTAVAANVFLLIFFRLV
nr:hypothetical protein [Actinopolyspora mzabensis]